MGSAGIKQWVRDEIVSVYGGANVILGAIADLGVHLSMKQINAILVIGNIVATPIVRHFTSTTPSTNQVLTTAVVEKQAALDAAGVLPAPAVEVVPPAV